MRIATLPILALFAASCATSAGLKPAPVTPSTGAQPTEAAKPGDTGAAAQGASEPLGAVVDKEVLEQLGPYRLGADYDSLKILPGFEVDEKRTDPAHDIQAGRIIDKRILEVPTIQRLIFKQKRLHRISIIFGSPDITEEMVKGWAAKQWGEPGPKRKVEDKDHYLWQAPGRVGMLMPADGGRAMVSLSVVD